AVPWEYLSRAVDRSAAGAVVLDRVPPAAMADVPSHLAAMMTERGLGNSPFFAVPETMVDEQSMLPKAAVEPIRSWLAALAADQRTRGLVVMKTLDGAISALVSQAPRITASLNDQLAIVNQLRQDAAAQFIDALTDVDREIRDGVLLRNEVLTRWQELVNSGDLMRQLESGFSRWRDRVSNQIKGEPIESDNAKQALDTGLEALLIQAGQQACERAEAAWQSQPAGRFVIEQTDLRLSQTSPGFPAAVVEALRRWNDELRQLVQAEGDSKKVQARIAALGMNAVVVSLILIAFGPTADSPAAANPTGTTVAAWKILTLVFGDDSVRRLAERTNELFSACTQALMSGELGRFTNAVERLRLDSELPATITAIGQEVDRLRGEELVTLSLQAVLTPAEQVAVHTVEGTRPGAAESVNSAELATTTVTGTAPPPASVVGAGPPGGVQ
ncbi:MAG: hypothetical protein LBL92_05840, partial [Propionibacteriaceae bacterium]|nr:hypothetical protein [Propionibacteriaceae bacterium]